MNLTVRRKRQYINNDVMTINNKHHDVKKNKK